jgi:hypothetical protein
MVVEFATTDAISAYHHFTCEFDTLVFSTNETDCHDMTEILLKVALSTITLLLRDQSIFQADVMIGQKFFFNL